MSHTRFVGMYAGQLLYRRVGSNVILQNLQYDGQQNEERDVLSNRYVLRRAMKIINIETFRRAGLCVRRVSHLTVKSFWCLFKSSTGLRISKKVAGEICQLY